MIKLYRGDCLAFLKRLPAGSVDAVVTDPPYGVGYRHGKVVTGLHFSKHHNVRIKGDDKPFDPSPWLQFPRAVLWGANFYSDRLPGGGWLVWDKRVGIEAVKFSGSDSELAFITGSRSVRTFRHLWFGVCRATENSQHYHPTQKPVALMRWCIEQLKLSPGATILDPYMGSGPVGVAAVELGFNYIGCEIDRGYFAVAKARINAAARSEDMSA